MGTIIICQQCSSTIGHFENEKVATLYGKCKHSTCQAKEEQSK
ncbi:GapA-binding peptide SR1P [Metabacillus fastidiosus]